MKHPPADESILHVTPQDDTARAHGCYWDEQYADHAVTFFERGLIHATGKWAGDPFTLQPWQRDLTRRIFGWRRDDGTRRHRSAFLFVPKKNGKTTWSTGLALYQLTAEPDPTDPTRTEQAAELYGASTSRENGSILYREAAKLARTSPALKPILRSIDHTRRVVYDRTSSFLRVLPHKHGTAEGLIASGIYVDEIHAMKDRRLYDALRYSGAARAQPLTIETTTAGVDADSLWRERYNYTRRVITGEIEDISHIGLIYEGDPAADIDDIDNLRQANPSLDVTINSGTILADARQALAGSAADIASFRRYRLNLPVGAAEGWIAPEVWDRGQQPFELAEMHGRPCYAGLDLGKVSDFSALCLLWPGDDQWRAAFWFWLPSAEIEAKTRGGDHTYAAWRDAGHLTQTDGETTDHHRIRAKINELAKQFNIKCIGIDRNFDGWQFTDDLFNIDGLPATGAGQGWVTQDVPMQRIEALVKEQRLNAAGNPIMRWMVGNAIAHRKGPNENMSVTKPDRASKIDGVDALINAMYVAESRPEGVETYYETSPLVIV
ncbi:MAG: terminase TerL endonuclease subunit [Planctomycetota bacterium]